MYLALDERLNRRVAIKAIWHHETPDDSFVEKLAHEAKVIANLSHPNVVHVHAFDVIDGIPVIEMEFIQGGSLAQRFRDEFVLPGEAVRHAYGVSHALAYSHGLGAIHRDVKPSNILIDQHGHARLADFGIAKVLAESEMIALTNSRSSVFRGTPYYAPPEAWDGEDPSVSWDLYSLGAVLYEAVSGTPPHVANTPLELAMKMATEPVVAIREVNARISPELGALIDELLERDPDARPESAKDTANRLEKLPEYISSASPEHPTTVVAFSKRKTPRKNHRLSRRTILRLTGVACLIGVVALAVGLRGAATQRIWNSGFDASKSTPNADTLPPLQDLSVVSAQDPLTTLLATRRPGTERVVYDARLPGIGEELRWLVELDDESQPARLLGFNDARLMHLELNTATDRQDVLGDWAAYADASGTVFRSGAIHGNLEWDARNKALLGSLVFVNDFDGAAIESTVTAVPAEVRPTDVQFAFWLEESDFLTPMLFHEFAPRDLGWASAFDQLFPIFDNGVLVARTHDSSTKLGPGAHSLDHSAWERIVERREPLSEDVIVGIPRNAAPIMRTSIQDDALRLDVQVSVPLSAMPVHFELKLVKDFLIPVNESPVFRLTHDPEDGSTRESYGPDQRMGVPGPSEVNWELADGVATISVLVPFDVFGLNTARPAAGARMRLSAAITSDGDADNGMIVAHWGFPGDGVAKHGALIRFVD